MKLALAVLCFLSISADAQINVTSLTSAKLPKSVKYSGKFVNAVRWADKSGDNLVVITETGVINSKNRDFEDARDAEVFAQHYLISGDKSVQGWKVYDFVKNCPLDVEASFLKNTFQVTDLDKDGVGEVWLMYKKACRSDVSPAEMKVIMYEGKQKYSMKGENQVKLDKETYGGKYTFDKAFNSAPKAFTDYAKSLWKKNLVEKFE
jgi:hypothetical protein